MVMSQDAPKPDPSRRHESGWTPLMRPAEGRPVTRAEREAQSLDVVFRTIASTGILILFGVLSAVLAAYLIVVGKKEFTYGVVVLLWALAGLLGLITASAILMLNRRRPFSPLVLLGLIPMAATAYWIIGPG